MAAATYGFPREHRLVKPADFQHVFDSATKSADAYLTVLARPNDLGRARLGLAISRKNIRKASDRNRIKRLVRESFRLRKAWLAGVDYVVMARSAANQADNETLRRSLEKHWKTLLRRCDLSLCNSSNSIAT